MNEPISINSEHTTLGRRIDPYGPAIKRPPVTLNGRWLVAARLGVMLFAVICVCSVVMAIPRSLQQSLDLRDIVGDSPSTTKVDEANQAPTQSWFEPEIVGNHQHGRRFRADRRLLRRRRR